MEYSGGAPEVPGSSLSPISELEAGDCSLNLSELQDASNGINLISFKGRGGVERHSASSAQDVEITSVLLERESPKFQQPLRLAKPFG